MKSLKRFYAELVKIWTWLKDNFFELLISFSIVGMFAVMVIALTGREATKPPTPTPVPTVTVTASVTVTAAPSPSVASGDVVDDAATADAPTPTVTTPKPKPSASKTPTPRQTPASRSYSRGVGESGYGWNLGGTDHPFLRCVSGHESWDWPAWDGNYGDTVWDAENPTSSASGAFMFIDSTWQNYARQLGIKTKHASDASPAIQVKVMLYAIGKGDFYHWNGTHCGYGT